MNRWMGSENSDASRRPSDLALDAHILESRSDEALDEGQRARADELRREAAAFRNSVAGRELEDHLAAQLRRRGAATESRTTLWWRPALSFAALATAVALAFILIPNHPDSTVGVKGNLAVEAWVQRADKIGPLRGGHILEAGDRVGFRVTCGENAHIALFGTGPDGAVPLVPADGRQAPSFAAGVRSELPGSALLDDQGHEERFVLVACPEAFEAGRLARHLDAWAAGRDAGPQASDAIASSVAPTCDTIFLRYPKR